MLVYGLAVIATAAVLWLRLALGPAVDDPLLLVLMVPVALAAYWGGLGPALVSTAAATAGAIWYLLPPPGSFAVAAPTDVTRILVLVGTGLAVSGTGGLLYRARNRARASERRLSLMLNATSEGLWDWNIATGEVYFSPRWIEALGYRADEVPGRIEFWESIVHPDDLPDLRERVRRHLDGHTDHCECVTRRRKRSGEYRWTLDRGSVVERDAAGRPRRIVGTSADITERRATEDALRQSEAQLHTIIESLSEGVVVADETGALLHWNRAGLAMHDFASLDQGMRHLERFQEIFEFRTLEGAVVPHDDWPLRRVLRGERFRNLDLQLRRTDIVWERVLSYGGTMVQAPGGRSLAVLTITDVTTRKRAEQALIASEERFRQLAENIRDVFWLFDVREQRVLYVSPAYEAIWGRSSETLSTDPEDWANAIHPDDRAAVAAVLAKLAVEPCDEEYRIIRPDGTVRWIHDQAFPVRDASGQVIRVAGIAEDITERRQLEAQVRQTHKMESIGRLAGGIAHDFNNWLTVITGYTDLVGEMLPPSREAVELVAEVKHAGERAAALTRQLLAFSRREVLEPRVLDLNAVVADAEKVLQRVLGEDIVLTAVLSPRIGHVRIDASQWIQVLMNLAVNARDAMPTGGRLTIETSGLVLDEGFTKLHPGVPPGRYVRLTVTDTGCGMTAETKHRLFEPFFTTKPVGEGTGMGLAVVHGIVEQSGGHVDVYSEPGLGTAFKFYLPVVEAVLESDPAAALAAETPGTETLLVVEDDPTVRRVTCRLLRRYGYTVLEAAGGHEALHLLEGAHAEIALLITDVVMPHMDGRELVEVVLSRYPGIRVLYTSGYTEDAVVRHGVLHAEVAFLQKPHTSQMLIAKIREVLGRPSAEPGPPGLTGPGRPD